MTCDVVFHLPGGQLVPENKGSSEGKDEEFLLQVSDEVSGEVVPFDFDILDLTPEEVIVGVEVGVVVGPFVELDEEFLFLALCGFRGVEEKAVLPQVEVVRVEVYLVALRINHSLQLEFAIQPIKLLRLYSFLHYPALGRHTLTSLSALLLEGR